MRKVLNVAAVTAAIITVSLSSAQAGLRDRCAASTGARSGSAFNACVAAGVARGEGRENDGRGAACRQQAGFTLQQWKAGQTTREQRRAWDRCMGR